jgi:threonine dehydrogenase-like Zn-dependent dehydrogenase
MKALSVFFIQPGHAEIREVDIPDPSLDQVQVRTVANGICMGEVSLFNGAEPLNGPRTVGHEGIAVVTKVGRNVTHLREGDFVHSWTWSTVENLWGHSLTRFATPPKDPALYLTEPVACVVTALYSYNITPGDRVLLIGAGFMGLLNVQGLAHCPLAELVVSDVKPHNLALAKEFGASEVIQSNTPEGKGRLEELRSQPFDLVVEAAGVEPAIQMAGTYVRNGGRLAIFAWHHAPRSVDLGLWHIRGITVLNSAPNIGTDHNTNSFHRAIKLLDRGTFDLSKLITHRHPIDDVQMAMELAAQRPAEYIKGVLLFDPFSTQ